MTKVKKEKAKAEKLVAVDIKLSENPAVAEALEKDGALTAEDKAKDVITVGVSEEDAKLFEEEVAAPEVSAAGVAVFPAGQHPRTLRKLREEEAAKTEAEEK